MWPGLGGSRGQASLITTARAANRRIEQNDVIAVKVSNDVLGGSLDFSKRIGHTKATQFGVVAGSIRQLCCKRSEVADVWVGRK